MTRDDLNEIARKHNVERQAALIEAVTSPLPLPAELVTRLNDLALRNKYIIELDTFLYARELVDNALAQPTTTKIPYDA